MNLVKKAAAAVVAAGIVLAPLTVVAESAHATVTTATNCAPLDRVAGADKIRHAEAKKKAAANAKKLAKAKKAEKKHPTPANKRKLAKAKKANASAHKKARNSLNRWNAEKKKAVACHKAVSAPVPASQVSDQVGTALTNAGVPAQAADPISQAVGTVLGGKLDSSQLDSVIKQLAPVLDALNQAGIPISTDTVESALAGLTGSGLSGSTLSTLINQITGPLAQAGAPAGQIGTAVQAVLNQLATQGGLAPNALVPDLIADVNSALTGLTTSTGIDLASLETTTNTIDSALTQTLDSLTGTGGALSGLAPVLDPILTGLGL